MLDEIKKSSAKERGKRLRLIRKMSSLTLDDLSARYNFGVSTIKYWECAKNQGLSSKGAKKIISAMQKEGVQCSYMWLMHGVGLPPQFINLCANRNLKDNIDVDQITYEEEKCIESEIKIFCENITNSIVLNVFDDGMEPFYFINDSVGGRRLHGDQLIKTIDKNCIVETSDNQILCRRVSKGNEKGTFNLYCVNHSTGVTPANLYDVKLLSAAPISRVWNRNLID